MEVSMTKEELQNYKAYDLEVSAATLKEMADLCRGLAMNPLADTQTQMEAHHLALEVAELQGPPEFNRWKEALQEQSRMLRIRMAYLLTREFPLLEQRPCTVDEGCSAQPE